MYITVTEHHVTTDWKIESSLLMTQALPERHLCENLAVCLQECASEYGIAEGITYYVHDNARNMQRACKSCKWSHLSCLGHTLQMAIKPALVFPEVSSVISRCRKLAGHFKHSEDALDCYMVDMPPYNYQKTNLHHRSGHN